MTPRQQETPPQPAAVPPVSAATRPGRTMFVQADPSTFREVVQRLTGAPEDYAHKLPITLPARSSSTALACWPKRKKLQERRRAPARLEIQPAALYRAPLHHNHHLVSTASYSSKGEMDLVSPVSTMDTSLFVSFPSPTTPTTVTASSLSEVTEEKGAIAEKGFFLYTSPRSRGPPPQLLQLFPLHSTRDTQLEH